MKLFALAASTLVGASCACEDPLTYPVGDLSNEVDPWNEVFWHTDADACFNPQIDNQPVPGIFYDTAVGGDLNVNKRAAVVHDADGTRIGCGLVNYDVWNIVKYDSDASGNAGADSVPESPVWGFEITAEESGKYVNAYGRVVVVHAENGDRIGCGCCVGENTSIPISPYPGTVNQTISGSVSVTEGNPGYVVLEPDLTGLEPSISSGIHIHVGTTCESADDVGGHLYRFNGAQIGPYPGYEGDKVVLGFADVAADTDHSIYFSTAFVNDAENGVAASSEGGVHIHTGFSCATHADVGGHLYNQTTTTTTSTTTTTVNNSPNVQLALGVAAFGLVYLAIN